MHALKPKSNPAEIAYEEQVLTAICEIGEMSWSDASGTIEVLGQDPISAFFIDKVPAKTAARQLLGLPPEVDPLPTSSPATDTGPTVDGLRQSLQPTERPIFNAVIAAMDEAETIHGPGLEGYLNLMHAIATEARTRSANARAALNAQAHQTEPSPEGTHF